MNEEKQRKFWVRPNFRERKMKKKTSYACSALEIISRKVYPFVVRMTPNS